MSPIDSDPPKIREHSPVLPGGTLEAIRQFDTCTIANSVERCGVRLRNEGFSRPGLVCLTGGFPRVLGYAATFRVRSSEPPVTGGAYVDRTDWWYVIEEISAPRVAVFESLEPATPASVAGEVHAAILKAFGCGGLITNGNVRDIPAVSRMAFPMFARHAAVSHSYAHVVEFGTPVEIFGLKVGHGDLIFADCHGAISIPLECAADLPRVAAEIRGHEQKVIDLCQSPEFSPAKLLSTIRGAD
jgi:regulator of RNase E activity RraA